MSNPFHSRNENYKYNGYRYAIMVKSLDHDKAVEYGNLDNTYDRKKYLNEPLVNRKPNNIDSKTYVDLEYPTYDKEGIISIDNYYVYYKDKVWSKNFDKYINILTTSKSKYVMIRDPVSRKHRRHILEEY
jgi:hypothetical protein